MQFKLLVASLLASVGLSVAAPVETRQESCPIVKTGDYVWQVDNLIARKLDGDTINSLSFHVYGTAGNVDVNCSSADIVEPGKFYQCTEDSNIQFAFQNDRSGLLLRQDDNGVENVGSVTVVTGCEHGGTSNADWVCKTDAPTYLTMVQYPKAASSTT
jgi:hypothetical protein